MFSFFKNMSPKKQAAMIALLIACMGLFGACINLSPIIPEEFHDSPIEQMVEHKIEKETGIEIDFTK